ncbi:hypothetical protein ACFFRR_011731 [Megaselia abdita]
MPDINQLSVLEGSENSSTNGMQKRLAAIRSSQDRCSLLFESLNGVIGELEDNYKLSSDKGSSDECSSDKSSNNGSSRKNKSLSPILLKKSSDNEFSAYDDRYPMTDPFDSSLVVIGPSGTSIGRHFYNTIQWSSSSAATRQLLVNIFPGEVLATHTLTGKPSPAFLGRERPSKDQLDPAKTTDIVYIVTNKCGVSAREVRATITTKCADSAKKYRKKRMTF